jgi:adenylate kinase family enzyme
MKYKHSKEKQREVLKKYVTGGVLVAEPTEGYLTDPNFGDFQAGVYAQGGSLGNHGLKQGDQIIKTMSGGVQKVKTKSGDIVYVNLANGYRGAEPPLPFKNGGAVKKNLSRDRKFVNYSQDYEVRYSKDKPKRHGYTKPKMSRTQFEDESFEFFADGGKIDKIKLGTPVSYKNDIWEVTQKKGIVGITNMKQGAWGSDFPFIPISKINIETELKDFYGKPIKRNQIPYLVEDFADGGLIGKEVTFMSQGEKDRGIIGEVNEDGSLAVDTGRSLRLVEKDEIVEIHDKPKKRGFFFADGGEIRRFNRHEQMDSETREEILDVVSEPNTPRGLVNYLYGLFDGYDYSKTANFKKEMEVLKSKDSRLHDRVIEIYKKIDNYKFEKQNNNYANGGVTKNYIDRNQLNTITIKKGDQKLTYKVSDVYNGAYKLEDGGNLEKMAFYVAKRNVVKVQLKNGKDVKVANGYWIKKGAKPIHTSKYDDGGQLEMKFAGGGKIETKIQKKVDEVNALIKKAIDSDGDPLMVVDTTGTWEEPMQYKPVVYKNGRLYIEYFEPYSGKIEKDVINKSNVDFDGYPTLLNIAKMYRKALKEKGISYAGGGNLKKIKFKDLVNKRFDIEIGSTSTSRDWKDEDEIKKYISEAIKHNLFDSEFYYNWTDNKKEYLEIFENDTLEPLLKNIDETLNDLFVFNEKPYPYGNKLKFKMNREEKQNWIDNWFKTNKSISQSLKKDYYNYRDEYAGVKLLKGGKTTFKEKATAIAKNFEGKKVKPKYQKEYGKTYDKAEAKEVGNKIAGSQKAKYDSKMSGGGKTKRGGAMVLAKQIRKDGESWASALKRANEQMKKK